VIEGIRVAPSPDWLRKKLDDVGIRSINNIVDITNYLLMELGQPMHAFDAKLVKDQTIVIRRAKEGETIKALDENEYKLSKDMLVIADTEKPIAIAGIMGGANSEVRPNTRTVILESAFFDPVSVHKTSKFLKLRSESSVRFERGVDWVAVEEALDRAAALIAELGRGFVLSGKIDKKGKVRKPKTITLRPKRVNQILGTDLSRPEMMGILKRLGFKVSGSQVTIPLFRAADISREIDLIEEIARVHGYGDIATTMPNTSFPDKAVDREDIFRARIREIMTGCGLTEVQTDSMVGPKHFELAGLNIEHAVKIANPLLVEHGYMRARMIPGLLQVVQHNLNRQVENIFIFEIGKIYLPTAAQKLPVEKWVLCGAATGSPFMSALDKGSADYFYLKGILENLLASLGIKNVDLAESHDHLIQPGKGASIAGLGILGQLHPDIKRKYDLEKMVTFFELDLEELFKRAKKSSKYHHLPKFPSVSRDIAMHVPRSVQNHSVLSVIREVGGALVEDAFLFDKYKDSLAYRVVYRDPARTLTDTEVNQKHEEIVRSVESKLNVRIRR
jgi:phenylalanyl-tRNA synthetase beta chain